MTTPGGSDVWTVKADTRGDMRPGVVGGNVRQARVDGMEEGGGAEKWIDK